VLGFWVWGCVYIQISISKAHLNLKIILSYFSPLRFKFLVYFYLKSGSEQADKRHKPIQDSVGSFASTSRPREAIIKYTTPHTTYHTSTTKQQQAMPHQNEKELDAQQEQSLEISAKERIPTINQNMCLNNKLYYI
jgi:hypothetical protein